jgi:hypothetical protein
MATGLGSRVRVSRNVSCYSTPELPRILYVVEPVSFGGDDSDFLVRPRTKVAFQSVLRLVERPHGENGVTSARVPRFHSSWSRDHLKHESTMYRCNYDRLTDRDKDSL